jgi:hypothetical protein
MAAEKLIVSTPITDVAEPYGEIVYLGSTPEEFLAACERALQAPDKEREARIAAVRDVLAEIGAQDVPQILVYNKLDALQPQPRALQDWIERANGELTPRVFVSATQGTGLDELRALLGRAALGGALSPAPAPPHEAEPAAPAIAGQSDPSVQTTPTA